MLIITPIRVASYTNGLLLVEILLGRLYHQKVSHGINLGFVTLCGVLKLSSLISHFVVFM